MAAMFWAILGGLALAAPKSDPTQPPSQQGNIPPPPVARPPVEMPRPAAVRSVQPIPSSQPNLPAAARYRYQWEPDRPSPQHDGRAVYVYVDGYGRFPSYYGRGAAFYPYAYPPVYVPAEFFYGQPLGQTPAYEWPPEPQPPRRDEEPPEPKPGALRGTNAQAVALAWKFIDAGDLLFSHQRYAEANERYRAASDAAPQLADAWFRRGFALAATNRYELSAAAFKRGLQLDATWPRSHFGLDDLFGRNVAAKQVRLDAMADAAVLQPNDFERLFVLGVHLYCDGQTARAAKYFAQAQHVAGGDNANYPHVFLAKTGK
jgi:tetratricopeptide (TPR) repeat protein